jgi:hypothetical protein
MTARAAAVALVAAGLAVAGCGDERQDEDEPGGEYALDVVEARFPERQTLAQHVTMLIAVRNTDDRELPNLAVTVETVPARAEAAPVAFAQQVDDVRLADPARPVWVLDRGPEGGDSASTNTWAFGPMFRGQTRELTWRLTAVRPGVYTVRYSVAPGLDGKAVAAAGQETTGSFEVTISGEPVQARVTGSGRVVRGGPPEVPRP